MRKGQIRGMFVGNFGWPVPLLIALILLPTTVVGQRACCEGNWWLKWNKDQRESYVWGFMTGFSHAYLEGCRVALKALPPGTSPEIAETAMNQCYRTQADFSSGTTHWAQEVTDFYNKYPRDRDVYISEVLEQLRNGSTLDQIHKYPFMRRGAPSKEASGPR